MSFVPAVCRRGRALSAVAILACATVMGLFPTAVAAESPKRGGILRRSLPGDATTLDALTAQTAQTAQLTALIYSNLLRGTNDDEFALEGDVAERWRVEGNKITFFLRPNVKFHDGSPLTAVDVKFSLDRVINPPQGLPSPRKGKLAAISSVDVLNPLTVVVTLKRPSPDFLYALADGYFHIYSKAFTEPLDATGKGLEQKALGSGPFILDRFVPGQIYELRRNPNYHFPGRPYLDGVKVYPIPVQANAAAALEAGRLDFIQELTAPSVIERLKRVAGLQTVHAKGSAGMAGLFFNMKKAPFSDGRFRRAVSLAIDRAEFYRALAPNLSHLQAGYGLMPAATKWNLSKEEFGRYPGMDTFPGLGGNAEANRVRARSLLKELGVVDGTKVKIMARADLASFTAPAIIITEHLKKIGLSVEVDMAESGTFYQRESNLDFDMVFHSMGLAGLFPDAILGEAWTSVGARNYAQWKNPEIDELFERQSGEPDEAKRRAIILQMARLHLDNMYWLFMNQSLQYRAHTDKVKGWLPHSGVDDNYHFDAMWLDQ